MRYQKLADAVSVVFAELNSFGSSQEAGEAVVRVFSASHRTLQQSFVRVVIIPILRHLADAAIDGRTDGRNEDSARLATKMLAGVEESDLYLPFI